MATWTCCTGGKICHPQAAPLRSQHGRTLTAAQVSQD
jgi:hypothetical protein